MGVLIEKNAFNDTANAKLDKHFLSFYGLIAIVFLAVFVSQYLNGVEGTKIYYYLALAMFFWAFFVSKLITVLFENFYKHNHTSVLFLSSLPRLSLFLLAFVFFKNIVSEEMNRYLVLIAVCVFFLFALLEAILKLKLFSRI